MGSGDGAFQYPYHTVGYARATYDVDTVWQTQSILEVSIYTNTCLSDRRNCSLFRHSIFISVWHHDHFLTCNDGMDRKRQDRFTNGNSWHCLFWRIIIGSNHSYVVRAFVTYSWSMGRIPCAQR